MKATLIVLAVLITFSYGCGNNSNTEKVTEKHDMSKMDGKKNSMMESMETMNTKMMGMQMTNNPDKDFAGMMKIHHEGAINMANIEIAEGKNNELLKMAAKMKQDQNAEVIQFEKFLTDTKDNSKIDGFGMELMESMKSMSNASHDMSTNIDAQFVSMMIPHHQGAINMAKVYLKYAKDKNLKAMAEQIVSSQQKEIEEMKLVKL